MAPAPQLAADDVTHGGDGALAEQVGLSMRVRQQCRSV